MGLAQLEEPRSPKPEDAGSNPATCALAWPPPVGWSDVNGYGFGNPDGDSPRAEGGLKRADGELNV